MKRKMFLFMCCVIVLIQGCKDDDNHKTSSYTLSQLDISNATTLFISPADNTRSGENSINRLFKITSDGIVEEVTQFDEEGNEILYTRTPEMIYEIKDSKYFVICMGNYDNYLVRKSDGAVFEMETWIGERWGGYVNTEYFVTDKKGNIYFSNPTKVMKLDISNPNNIVMTEVTTEQEGDIDFTVSSNGDVFYYHNGGYRVRKSNGGIFSTPETNSWLNSWRGLDGNLKYITGNDTTYIIKIDEKYNASIEEKPENFYIGGIQHPVNILYFEDKVLLVGSGYPNYKIQEIENKSGILSDISINYDFNTVLLTGVSKTHYYLSGNNSKNQPYFIKIDPYTNDVTELIKPEEYDIYSFCVSEKGEVNFNALRMSDGIKVIGQISSTGTIKIIDEKLDKEIKVLQRIQ